MKKVTEFVKTNKKIIIVVVLLAALLLAVYFINKSGKAKDSTVSTDVAGKSTTENKLCAILKSINGVGEANVMINEGEGGILGVVIVCEGARRSQRSALRRSDGDSPTPSTMRPIH